MNIQKIAKKIVAQITWKDSEIIYNKMIDDLKELKFCLQNECEAEEVFKHFSAVETPIMTGQILLPRKIKSDLKKLFDEIDNADYVDEYGEFSQRLQDLTNQIVDSYNKYLSM